MAWKVWAISVTAALVLVSACSVATFREKDAAHTRSIQACQELRKVDRIACKAGICD